MPLLVANERPLPESPKLDKFVANNVSLDIQKNVADLVAQNSPVKSRKAKRIRFLANGDRFCKGVIIAITPERYRSFDSLLNELTRALSNNVNLATGVRVIYTMDGQKVSSLDDLEDGKFYVCSGQGDTLKRVDYSVGRSAVPSAGGPPKLKPARSFTRLTNVGHSQSSSLKGTNNHSVRPRIIIVLRNGNRPRKVFRLLLSKRNAPSFDHALSNITDVVKLDTGAVRKIFTSHGSQVTTLDGFFDSDDVFYAYGSERVSADDFALDFEGRALPKLPNKTKALKVQKRQDSSLNISSKVLNNYSVGQIIGDGNFAVVRKCVDKTKNIEYALKIIDKSKCIGKEHMIENEVAILRLVRHPNIIQLMAEHDTPAELYLVMELVKGGDLFDAISRAVKFPESDAQVMTQNLASALAYLHDHKIVHRDIKPENLLVEMDGERLKLLKVGDFGLAQIVNEPLFTVCGTPTYVAPEILTETGYGLEIDVWAMGVILYIMLCGFPPFVSANNDQEELFDDILSGQYGFPSPYWDQVSDLAKDLISHMLQSNPELRFSAEDVLDHPWFEISEN
ncbi:unnamed protein product [Nesidiocoris tenuis]|uniref:non-specific serine/threonine protein kinase n=1 Tax=Nesidiocoris tenuis TaxID=355587 RepID=A0A6H5H7X2_9HEMI|nr:unnamed protein product [Nesidiocoris tenuis]